jgi:tetratricopeptide (TPR) repeat protein
MTRIGATLLVLFAPVCGWAADAAGSLQSAIEAYEAAMETVSRSERLELFARSEQLFRQVVEGDDTHPPRRNAALYVNLGNAALQAERIGPAIAAYRRALLLDPQHAQARQNLAYARSLVPDWIRYDQPDRLIDSLFFWRAMAPRGTLTLLSACCLLAAALLWGVGLVRRQPLLRNFSAVPLLLWCVLEISLLLSPDNGSQPNAVVRVETTVYTADSENAAPRLSRPLPNGAEVVLLIERDQWSEIRLPDGRTGWVFASALEPLTH